MVLVTTSQQHNPSTDEQPSHSYPQNIARTPGRSLLLPPALVTLLCLSPAPSALLHPWSSSAAAKPPSAEPAPVPSCSLRLGSVRVTVTWEKPGSWLSLTHEPKSHQKCGCSSSAALLPLQVWGCSPSFGGGAHVLSSWMNTSLKNIP